MRVTVTGRLEPKYPALGRVAGTELALCLVDGQLFATSNLCTHADARLSDGELAGYQLICPFHGGSFDVRDGSALTLPCIDPIDVYPAKLEDGEVFVKLAR